jgi:importin subunit alpha-1
VITVALEGLENMLRVGKVTNSLDALIDIISDCGGISALENLQNHPNKNIYSRAVKLLETFFTTEEDDGTEGAGGAGTAQQPQVVMGSQGQQQFSFGVQPPIPPTGGQFPPGQFPPSQGGGNQGGNSGGFSF